MSIGGIYVSLGRGVHPQPFDKLRTGLPSLEEEEMLARSKR